MKPLTAILVAGLLATSVLGRDWTNASGKTIKADLVEIKGTQGAEVAVLKMADGRSYEVPLAQLSATDQAFAKENAVAKPAAAAAPTEPSVIKKMLDGKLVAVTGKRVGKHEMTTDPEYYAFYFSAHWCPPCRLFTPKLVEFYNSNEAKKTRFEVIFVSSDHGEDAMEEYMKEVSMPWPAIAFRQVERLKDVKKYGGKGIPCLVLVDREGKVLSHSYEGETYVGPTKVMNDLGAKLRK